ncbi:MarR family winged helix-turn-helix transcriptional regulator [Aureimonas jatrophae]|jgi:MarR family transcriptional regulator, organic hydroperoxide resistance regulator|uniref:DNA-binding transcriptional regulator, MarR family n=1 Tax=Aureimonas jatrophae TaxID=1166073 RepID=A0A1H0HVL8_9HYPH|nr:MarR family transcriptional regulator [Aureimonas jatrophae]MBB3950800.1 DNA-binding MarR family transcriptional regulator [Aureimonas jatrophae]SDO23203.1 DNA-binding transcriptional regulator, MarR family [Aureimonas jatrophae]
MTRSASAIPLDDQLCFSLYGASMAVGRAYKPLLDRMGITYPQYLLLSALGEEDERSIGAIADRLMLESSTITPLVKRLAAAGLVDRERNPQNERQVIVRLTQAGRALLAECACLGERLVSAANRPVTDLARLNEEVRTLRDALDASLARG